MRTFTKIVLLFFALAGATRIILDILSRFGIIPKGVLENLATYPYIGVHFVLMVLAIIIYYLLREQFTTKQEFNDFKEDLSNGAKSFMKTFEENLDQLDEIK